MPITLEKPVKSPVEKTGSESAVFGFLNKEITLFGKKMPDKKKEAFYLELSILLSAGVDIKSALELIAEEQTKEKDKALLLGIKEKVVIGKSFSEALRETDLFTDYEIYSLQIGEETGQVVKILEELSDFFKNKIKQKRQAMSALTYPMIVLFTSVGVLAFMLNVIVPMFSDVFTRFGGELPYLTQLVINVSDGFGRYFYPVAGVLLGVGIFLYSRRNELWFRKNFSLFLLKIPVLGELIRKIYLARFCHTMHLLISSKIPLLRALGLVHKMIGFYPIEDSLVTIEKDILKGEALNKALSAFPIYHKRTVSLIKVGEEVNRLDDFFQRIYQQYTEDIDHQSKVLTTMIEPFMIIFLGLIVGIILVAMYLPMFKLSTVF